MSVRKSAAYPQGPLWGHIGDGSHYFADACEVVMSVCFAVFCIDQSASSGFSGMSLTQFCQAPVEDDDLSVLSYDDVFWF